jgi:hypothetical protein
MKLEIYLGVQSESADLVNQAREAFGRLVTSQEDSTFILEAFKNYLTLKVQGSRQPERTVAQNLARMLHDALLAAIAATPLPSHVNLVNYNKTLTELLEVSNAGVQHRRYSVEVQLRIILDNHMREFIRTRTLQALRILEPGTVALQASQTSPLTFEQASAASTSLGASKHILADFTNSQQRGESFGNSRNFYKKRKNG